jgi:putative transposase
MGRLARVVIPGLPHHITQRGNRRQQTFFQEEDYAAYLELMAQWCREEGVEIWAYSLLPNHAHLIAVPAQEESLRRAIGEAHRRYTRRINLREEWRGYLWEGRFASFVLDEPHLLAAARHVELNPVRAKLVGRARDWRWSSARAHLAGRDDPLVTVAPLLAMVDDWKALLRSKLEEKELEVLREHGRTGRPLGSPAFVDSLERLVGRVLQPQKRGPKPRPPKRRRRTAEIK